MKRTIIATLLLISFGMAEETSQTTAESNQETTQKTKQEIPKNLQDLGRGYPKDPTTNQIYYEEKLIEVYSPNTFEITSDNDQNINKFDASDHYANYHLGNFKEFHNDYVFSHGNLYLFDLDLGVPIQCFDYISDPIKLTSCYQKIIYPNSWPDNPPIDAENFKALGYKNDQFYVTDGYYTLSFGSKSSFIFNHKDTDIESFVFLKSFGENIHYYKDRIYVYYNNNILEGADSETFEILDKSYSKDKNYVFFEGKILKNAINTDFKVLDSTFKITKDSKNLFFRDQILTGFDYDTFKVVKNTPIYSMGILLLDKDNIYYFSDNNMMKKKSEDQKFHKISLPINLLEIELLASTGGSGNDPGLLIKSNNELYFICNDYTGAVTENRIDASAFDGFTLNSMILNWVDGEREKWEKSLKKQNDLKVNSKNL